MIKKTKEKLRKKSKLATQANILNIILIFCVFTLITIVSAWIFNDITSIIHLLLVVLPALVLYILLRNVLMDKLIFTPLSLITQSISKGNCAEEVFFGSDRDDEIGELAKAIKAAARERERQKRLLYEQEGRIREANKRTQTLLDAMPFGAQLWDKNLNIIDCNAELLKYFNTEGKQDYLNRFFDFSPEYQSDGQLSTEKAAFYLTKAFNEGKCVLEWIWQMPDGTQVPMEITLVRITLEGEEYVAAYTRDLSEYKQMMGEIDKVTDSLRATADKLEAVIANYSGLIWSVDNYNIVTLFNGRYLDELSLAPGQFEGAHISDAILIKKQFTFICEGVEKTISAGPQDWYAEWDGRSYRIRTTPLYSENGDISSIVGSFDDVTERVRLQAELKAALKEAQDASNAKTRFLANMSHEMRTPLNAVIGLSELTLESGGLSEEALDNLEKINSAGATLLSTVNDILDISKIEAGKFEIVPVDYDIPSLLNDAITQSVMRIGDKPITFVLDINNDLPTRLFGDDLRIKQMLNNLLSNAFKYTRQGTVELGLRCEKLHNPCEGQEILMTIWVRDTGIGIKPENITDLFSDYAKMELASNRKIEGTGLGLPITKRVARMMGGSIDVESEYGKGSVFTIKILQGHVCDKTIGREVADCLKSFKYSDHKRRRKSGMTRISMPYARVLVVDDVQINLDVAKGMLKPYGMQVDCASSGQEAIDMICKGNVKYNAVFMDHMMPGMDGIEATRRIRAWEREQVAGNKEKVTGNKLRSQQAMYDSNTHSLETTNLIPDTCYLLPDTSPIPIIALTANAIVGNEAMFLENGFQAFISKPIETGRLDAVVREWVRDKEQEKKLGQIIVNGNTIVNTRSGNDRRSGKERRNVINRRKSENRGQSDMEKNNDTAIKGFDINKGIERFNNDKEAYMQVLSSFVYNTPPLLEKAKNPNKDTLAEYGVTVHGIKGACRGICAEKMAAPAEALEKAAKAGDLDFVLHNNDKFVKEAQSFISDLNKLLQSMLSENPKPQKVKIEREVLSDLLTACKNYDIDAIDTAMEQIESFSYTEDDELALWLRQNIRGGNYKQIVERLGNGGVRSEK